MAVAKLWAFLGHARLHRLDEGLGFSDEVGGWRFGA